jgi:hypothetical protein
VALVKRASPPLRDERSELVDLARAAGARADMVAVGANPSVGGRVDVEAAIKIERGAALLEPGADAASVAKDQIDAVLAEQGRAGGSESGRRTRARRRAAAG